MKSHKLLYLLVDYAPHNIVSTFRHLKLTKYLERHGFQQFIFTGEYTTNINLNLNEDIPKSAIVFRKKLHFPEIQNLSSTNISNNIITRTKILIKDIFFSPDKCIWWVLSYLPKMIKTIKKEKIKLVMTSGSPFSTFVGAYFLKKLCKVKIIIDFRDPWSEMPISKSQGFIRRTNINFWEKVCVENADLITVCTDEVKQNLENKYHPKDKIIVIPNGFDLDDYHLSLSTYHLQPDTFTFLYAGKYSLDLIEYNPTNLIKAFDLFTKKYSITDSRLILVGQTDDKTKDFIKSFDNQNIVSMDKVPKSEVIQMQNQADAFIHFYYPQTHTDTISMKIVEYAICNRPILSLNLKEGALYRMIKDNQLGETADTHNIDEIAGLFFRAYKRDIIICESPIEQLKEYNVEYTASILTNKIKEILQDEEN